MIRIIDDFLPNPAEVRARALASPFVDWPGPDGEVYRRVWLGDIPEVRAGIERAMGPVDMLGMGFRLNFLGELPNAAIHSDLGWGTHALVLYLCDGRSVGLMERGGTAFWRHRATGASRIEPGDTELLEKVQDDWNDVAAWDMRSFVNLRMNRALIYESAEFHSRYPFPAFGTGPEDGRLTAVAFFSPRAAR